MPMRTLPARNSVRVIYFSTRPALAPQEAGTGPIPPLGTNRDLRGRALAETRRPAEDRPGVDFPRSVFLPAGGRGHGDSR
jgi:hypothetical protein